MIKQNVFIINFNSLYEILDEIKENLSFKIIKFKNEDDFINNYEFPLSLNKLLELINIQLIKLKFNQQSKININNYELNLNSKSFSKDDLALRLTEKEIEIILYLAETKTKHDVSDLQKNIWGYSADMETHTVETHIYRLRKKISNKFNDENFILSHQNGYFIE